MLLELVAAGSVVDFENGLKCTPLRLAVRYGKFEASKILVQLGADLHHKAVDVGLVWLIIFKLDRRSDLQIFLSYLSWNTRVKLLSNVPISHLELNGLNISR